ncbi:MAG: UDP-N-acetylglucosamine--N-acetylmuramyl-(pentapeptide) pyrophosphoryl-undecaprenol N-acetylglucosamine transferase [Hyphomicrobiaceae bacterium hypho_1]
MTRTILLAAGGTGGHLFPAFALAEELGRRGYAVDIATDKRGNRFNFEYPGRHVYQIPSATTNNWSPVALTKTVFMLVSGVCRANIVLKKISADAVIGFGGYPSFPTIVAALLKGIPTATHEQNAVLGRANKILASRVKAIATSFDEVKFITDDLVNKVHMTGNPVRQIVIESANRIYNAPLAKDPINLLVFGGSQGARYFSDIVPLALRILPQEIRTRLFVTQQCRPEDLDHVLQTYNTAGIKAVCKIFFSDMPQLMAKAHLVIARAGASTISELSVIGCPSVLIPLPNTVYNDQLENAEKMVKAGAAWCLEQDKINVEQLASSLTSLLMLPTELENKAAAARRMGRSDSVAKLADLTENLAKRTRF